MNTPAKNFANFLVALIWLVGLAFMVLRREHYFWDFRVYHAAAQSFLSRQDPYEGLFRVYIAYGWHGLPYVYPPLTLFLLAPFGWLSADAAALVWLAFKLVALAYLFKIWKRSFAPVALDYRLGLLLLFGFNAALYTDLASGNAALFEAVALFAAVEALLKDRLWNFTALVVAVSLFKFLPLIFLGLLPIFAGKRGWRPAIYGVFAMCLYVFANVAVNVQEFHEFLFTLGTRDEDRANNPTLYTFCRDLGTRANFQPWLVLYLIGFGLLAYFTFIAVRNRVSRAPVLAALFLWTAFAIASPRFMIYTYVELIPMAWLAISWTRGVERWILVALTGFVTPTSYLFIQRPGAGQALGRIIDIGPACYGYFSMFAALGIWMVLRRRLLNPEEWFELTA